MNIPLGYTAWSLVPETDAPLLVLLIHPDLANSWLYCRNPKNTSAGTKSNYEVNNNCPKDKFI
jgi:hypothetical protein